MSNAMSKAEANALSVIYEVAGSKWPWTSRS